MSAPLAATDPLDALTVEVPCAVPWESMTGDARTRFCGTCRLHVHDVSEMTSDEALALLELRRSGERVCLRIWRRPDGRVLTRDCRSAVRALRRRAALTAAALFGVLGLGGFAWVRAAAEAGARSGAASVWEVQPFRTVAKLLPASWLPNRPPPVLGR